MELTTVQRELIHAMERGNILRNQPRSPKRKRVPPNASAAKLAELVSRPVKKVVGALEGLEGHRIVERVELDEGTHWTLDIAYRRRAGDASLLFGNAVERLVERLGGPTRVGVICGVSTKQVERWRMRGEVFGLDHGLLLVDAAGGTAAQRMQLLESLSDPLGIKA